MAIDLPHVHWKQGSCLAIGSCQYSGGRPQTMKEFWKCVENTLLLRWSNAVPVGILPLTPRLKGLGRNRLWFLPLMLFCLKGVIPTGIPQGRRTLNGSRYSQKFADLRWIPKPHFSMQECHQQRGWAEGGCSGGTSHSKRKTQLLRQKGFKWRCILFPKVRRIKEEKIGVYLSAELFWGQEFTT